MSYDDGRRTGARVEVDDLLDAAARAFAEHGVARTTMIDVARSAGCSRATLYRSFPSREALHLAFVHRAALRIAADLAPASATRSAGAMVDLVAAGIAAIRADPLLAAWFQPENVAIPIAVSQDSELLRTMTTALAGALDPDARSGAEVELRGAWLLRCIVSFLAMPAEDPSVERAMLETFVAPLLVSPTPR
ncbi:DNA-binding transcriptional repressor AcrR [Nocardioides dokdonensis FR1436]|uniref:DNA-binding transcriptional repressor AcrR n=1 Tax=Nocardioides dokdonensis FR1436 TaxID=1300347 RepID=A0A1A9GFR1_9ACTN|nr:TetR/AcrR family transcriptional regulator [Nocardioides dokdonensis]ANH37084.1 DNA-binding transcriptional repressor AcrR [Nocardioides dokdonensis FR1436]